jgi:hypothetical protein
MRMELIRPTLALTSANAVRDGNLVTGQQNSSGSETACTSAYDRGHIRIASQSCQSHLTCRSQICFVFSISATSFVVTHWQVTDLPLGNSGWIRQR